MKFFKGLLRNRAFFRFSCPYEKARPERREARRRKDHGNVGAALAAARPGAERRVREAAPYRGDRPLPPHPSRLRRATFPQGEGFWTENLKVVSRIG